LRLLGPIAQSDSPVLILGEQGAGKRFLAAEIHARSSRCKMRFEEIRCGETNAAGLEAALSSPGTLYLDEITELELPLQELLTSAWNRPEGLPACRLLAGSRSPLQDEVKSWRMREDFYFLLATVTLQIPPLRFRKAEILAFADQLLTRYAEQFDRPRPVLSQETVAHLLEHPWPGNLSELQTAMKTFVAIGDQAISLAAIKAAAPAGRKNAHPRPHLLKEATRASSIQIERQLISEVLASTHGNRKRAALELGISYKALLYKLKQIEAENQSLFHNKNGVAK